MFKTSDSFRHANLFREFGEGELGLSIHKDDQNPSRPISNLLTALGASPG